MSLIDQDNEPPAKIAKMSHMQKTPVSILQEIMVKKGTVPNYELIHDGGGTHENTFTYRVTCQGLEAAGTGRCKKDAKHTAASNMLDAIREHNGFLPLPASPAKPPVRAPPPQPKPEAYIQNPNEPFINAIGALQDLCAENELPDPVYQKISDVGPPHARVFTMQCILASFKEEGISTTKKQAKHLAARNMYQRIIEVLNDAIMSSELPQRKTSEEKDSEAKANSDRVKCIFVEKKGPLAGKKNLGIKLADYHKKIHTSFPDEVRQKVSNDLDEFAKIVSDCEKLEYKPETFDDLLVKFEEALTPLNADASFGVICGNVQVMKVTTTPELVEYAYGDEATWKLQLQVYQKMIRDLQLLLI